MKQTEINYSKRKSCPECGSLVVSKHKGKFKCHDCNYCIYYNTKTGKEIKDGPIHWF